MYTVTVDHVSGHNQESFLNVLLHSQQWMDSGEGWKDSGQTWMDSGQTENIQTFTSLRQLLVTLFASYPDQISGKVMSAWSNTHSSLLWKTLLLTLKYNHVILPTE